MGRRNVWVGGLWAAVLVLSMTSAAAQEAPPSYADGMWRKLGRGAANLLTCPAELLRTSERVGRRDGAISGVTVGVVQGLWRGLLRGGAGAIEVATFFLEVPKGFRPIIQPEFVWAHGNWAE